MTRYFQVDGIIAKSHSHNPLGKVFSREELQAIGDLCVKHNVIIVSDEVCFKFPCLTTLSILK